jgi:hypothetical protein
MKVFLSLQCVAALSVALLISVPAAQAAGGRVVTPSGPDTESCGTAAQLSESVSRSPPKSDQNLAALKLLFLLSAVSCFCGRGEDNKACSNLVAKFNAACGGIDFTCVASRLSRLPRSR